MFNFYVVLAGHDMVTDAGRATTCRRKFKAPWLQTKVQKMKDLPKAWVLTGKQFENFRPKKSKIPVFAWRTKQRNHKTPKAKTEHEPCSQEEINWSKIEKSIHIKTVAGLITVENFELANPVF